MPADLTNLLPPERKRALTRSYFLRLAVVAFFLAALLVLIHGILLAPSYIYLMQQIGIRESQLASFAASTGTREEQEARARITLLEANATRLIGQSKSPTVSAAMRTVLAAPRTGIRITGIAYGPGAAPDARKMTLKGVAANREVLRSYVQALGELPSVDAAELPISAYAKEQDIDFTLTLTGTFLP
ncbi:MAG TPA: hypothetical protein VFY28_02140 [Candidatus Paceibacterota bacterium]|nr:hypothetical protein [Candidatus Paceibacterota bacterium]